MGTTEKVGGSAALVWKSSEVMSRARPKAARSPMPTPRSDTMVPWRSTMRRMWSRSAPSAMRIPISWVCWVTAYDMTP